MENKILEFSKKLQEKIENDKNRQSIRAKYEKTKNINDLSKLDFLSHINFKLCYDEHLGIALSLPQFPLITLDNEDLDYFKTKYLPKIENEYQEEINKIKKKYGRE